MAHAAQRGWVWCRRWQGAVGVVDCQCRLIDVVQLLLVRLVSRVNNWLNVMSVSKSMVVWGSVHGCNWQVRGHSVLCEGE